MDKINHLLGCWSYKVASYYEIKAVGEEIFWSESTVIGKLLPATEGADWEGKLPADFPADWYVSLNNGGTMWLHKEGDDLKSVYLDADKTEYTYATAQIYDARLQRDKLKQLSLGRHEKRVEEEERLRKMKELRQQQQPVDETKMLYLEKISRAKRGLGDVIPDKFDSLTVIDSPPSFLVLDSGAFIAGQNLERFGPNTRYFTIPDVLIEIKDAVTRHILDSFPYKIETRVISADAMKAVSSFSKMTGDFKSLSRTDLKVLALAYLLEKEQNGMVNIREKIKVNWSIKKAMNEAKIKNDQDMKEKTKIKNEKKKKEKIAERKKKKTKKAKRFRKK